MGMLNKPIIPGFFKRLIKKNSVRIGLWVTLFFCVMLGVLSIHFVPERTNWEVGQVCKNDVQANRYVNFIDEAATAAKQKEALQGFNEIYKIDIEKFNTITIVEIGNYFAIMEDIILGSVALNNTDPALTDEEAILNAKVARLKGSLKFQLTDEQWVQVASFTERDITKLHDKAVSIANNTMIKGVSLENLGVAKENILEEVATDRRLTDLEETILADVLSTAEYQPTYVLDEEATALKRSEILASVESVHVVVQKGELVVGKGEVLTEAQYQKLYQLGYTNDGSPVVVILGLAVLMLLVIYIGKIYLENFAKNIYNSERQLILLMLVVVLTVTMYKLIISLNLSPMPEKANQVGFLIPVAMGTMLIAILQDAKSAIMVNIIFSAFVGLYTGDVSFMIVALVSGIVGAVGVSHLSQRSDMSKTALMIGAANTVAIVALGLLNNHKPDIIFMGVVFGIGNGFLSSVLTIGILPYLESLFGITTAIKLLELANPNQPLLKKLLLEAPGTYHHSVMVGNLGEAAAEAIGANGLVVRLGAYYHDIGKTKRPYFFAENQFGENPHDKITPTLSTLILTSHVKDGVEMAHEAKVPPVIVDLIAQHHGNSLVGFFYHKAKEGGEEIREEDFRYDQAKPQTKEAAILMMADTVEAAVRSKKNATQGQIEGFIRTLIKGKLNDGQFDECDLTFKDLDKIASAFVRVVNGIYHKRIEYPDQTAMLKQKEKKGNHNGNSNHKRAKTSNDT